MYSDRLYALRNKQWLDDSIGFIEQLIAIPIMITQNCWYQWLDSTAMQPELIMTDNGHCMYDLL